MEQLHLTFKPGVIEGMKMLANKTGHKSMNALIRTLLLEYAQAQPDEIRKRKTIDKMICLLEEQKNGRS
jgi:hypothetical protein